MSTAGTTQIIAKALIRRDRQLLLAREPTKRWSFLPGGSVEPGESVEAALIREIAEELATEATITALLGVIEHGYHENGDYHHELNLVFEVAITDTNPTSEHDHLQFHWQPLDTLATAALRPQAMRDALATATSTHLPFWRGWAG